MRVLVGVFACAALVAACKGKDDRSTIEKPADPAPSKSAKVVDDDGPRRSKGRCFDGTYEKQAPESLGLTQPAFQSPSAADSVALGAIAGTTTPPPPPYSLVATTESAPPGADPDDGARVLCDRFDAVRGCFDAVRSKISFHEYVTAHVAVDDEGNATKVTKVEDETLRSCLASALKVTNLPKPSAAGAWVWRFTVMPPTASPDSGNGLDSSSVQKVVSANSVKVKKCYEKALAAGGKPSGKLSVAFTIEPSGDVTKAHAAPGGTLTDPTVVACIVGVVATLHFPQPATGAGDAIVPFNFVAK